MIKISMVKNRTLLCHCSHFLIGVWILICGLGPNGGIIFKEVLKIYKGIRVCKRKEPFRFVIVGASTRLCIYCVRVCRTGECQGMNSVWGMVDFQYRLWVLIVYVTSVLSCKERSNEMYYNDTQRELRSGKLLLRIKVL